MRVACVDGNESDLTNTVALCREHPAVDYVSGFRDAADVLNWDELQFVDLLMLDTDLPEIDGIKLAAMLRKRFTRLPIIFLTTNARCALEAYSVHPFSYLLKPLDKKTLDTQLNQLLLSRAAVDVPHILVQTFGTFAITVDGRTVHFERARSKELLALLVDRRGGEVSRKVAFTEMWDDREYDAKAQNYFNVIVNSLRYTLNDYGISEIFEMSGGFLRIRPELIDCDLYRYLRGDPQAEASFRGAYLYGYSWAMWGQGY